MISIKQALENIMKAYYGNEVRTSIHDAIYLINEKAVQAVNTAESEKESAKSYADYSANKANESMKHAEESSAFAEEAKKYSNEAGSKASDALESAQIAENSVQLIKESLQNDIPNFEIDFNTGHLFYTGAFLLNVNDAGHLMWSIA